MGIKHRMRVLIASAAVITGMIVAGLILYMQHQQTLAQYNQDDNSGQWQLTFQSRAGIFSQKDIVVDGKRAHATVGQGERGEIVTSTITPASSYGWRHLAITGTWSSADHVKVQLLTCAATPSPIPQQDAASIRGGTNTTGFVLEGGYLDISSLDSEKYPCIQVKLLLSSDQAAPAPIIKKIGASWKPKTVFLIKASAQEKITTSENLNYTIDYSVSYVDDANVIVYMPAPKAATGSFTESYAQDLTPSFKSATQGGQYTSKEITLNGVTIPANSVYWNLGTQTAGVTGSLHATFGTHDGLQNGVLYQTSATIVSPNTAAIVSDNDGGVDGSQLVSTIVESKPLPSLQKTATGITLKDTTHVHGAAPYNNRTTYSLQIRNDGIKKETMFNVRAVDDLSDVIAKLQSPVCGNITNPVSRISGISDAGVLSADAKTITWNLGNIAPNAGQYRSFTVDYSGCAKDTKITNMATLSADNIKPLTDKKLIIMGIDATPQGMFAKGERTKVQGRGYINAGIDDSAPESDDLTDLRGKTQMGGLTTYLLSASNRGAVRLDDTVMMDMIPTGEEFVAATLPSNVKGQIFYYTNDDHTDSATPPAFDHKNLNQPGNGWSSTVPTQANTVRWVAFYVPCLSPTGVAAGGSCADRPNAVVGEITVKVTTPQDICKPYTITNKGVFRTFSAARDIADQSDAAVQPLVAPLTLHDDEVSHIIPSVASFKGGASINGPSQLRPTESGNYTITYTNNGAATAKDAMITVSIPTVPIAGKDTLLDFVNFSGAPYEKVVDPASGKIGTLSVKVGDIPVGASRQFTLTVALPRGPKQNNTFKITASLKAADSNNCVSINETISTTTEAIGSPKLQVIKQRDEGLIKPKGDIHYNLAFRSIGDVPTTDTFVIDRVPTKTVFKHAYTEGKDDNGTAFQCPNCKVYFASANAPLPANISPTKPLTPADIYRHFSPGVQTTPGVWAPPATIATKDVLYVAYLTDDTILKNPQTNSGVVGRVGMVVTNDDDGSGAGADGSADGTIVTNYAAIISNETLQAISNSVHTTILGDPGLAIKKTAAQATVTAGETIDWFIDYHNDSQTKDTDVTIEDVLPYGVALTGLSHQWNQHAHAQGLSTTEQDIMNSPHVSLVTNPDGTTKLTVKVAQGLRGGDLFFKEGGRLHIKAVAKQGTASGTVLTNEARGCYQNELVGPFCINDSSSVTVHNADLWLRKQVNNSQPVAGDTLIYSLVIANKGEHTADNVVIKDTLPAGLCYEDINITTPTGWSVGRPHIEGDLTDCQHKPTTLVWSRDHNNALTNQGSEAGRVPGNSVDITLQYSARIHTAITPGAALTNGAVITTDTQEDQVYSNGDNKTVATPLPDPYVRKTASRATVLPGDTVDYYIAYGNTSREVSLGSVIIDGLPDYDGDGRTDVTVLSAVPQHGEAIYYYDETTAPKLQTLQLSAMYNFAGNANFKRSINDFTPGTYPTHIIIVPKDNGKLPMLDGPHNVMVKVQFTNPYTSADTPAGTTATNHVEITSTTPDGNPKNNTADSSVKTPTADLSVTKTARPSGSFPGAAPGEQIEYAIRFANHGTSPVCSVFVKEYYPNNITNIAQSFAQLHLVNAGGAPMNPVDPTGAQISAPVPVIYDTAAARWQLGGADYANVCLPPGAEGSFTVTATIKDNTPDKQTVENTVEIGEDSPATEDTTENNRSTVSTTVYRADVRIKKDGFSAGKDGVFGTADDSATEAKPKEHIRYSLAYNNSGNRDAKDTIIDEVIPTHTCFTVGSVKNYPAGTKINYSNDDGNTYTYTPQGNDGEKDCNVTHFRVHFGTLSAPANLAAGSQTAEGEKREFMGGVVDAVITPGHAAALKADGTLWAWGSNHSGQIGNGTTANQPTPVKILDNVTNIAAKSNYTVALKTDGSLWAWGDNSRGQLGTGDTVGRLTPTYIINNVKSMYLGKEYVVVLKTDGTVQAWGANDSGQVSYFRQDDIFYPTHVMSDVKSVSVGDNHALAIKTDNTLWAWGDPAEGRLGVEQDFLDGPVKVMDNVKSASAGGYHSTALKADGTLWAWGNSTVGQVGNGSTAHQYTPVKILDEVASVVAEGVHSAALKTDGTLWTWGHNDSGKIGNGTTTNQLTPVQVLDNVRSVAASYYNTVAIKTDNTLWAWGSNISGSIGNGTTTSQLTPVQVLDNVRSVATSYNNTVAIKTDNTLWAWGSNYSGQLGNGATADQFTPSRVHGTGAIARLPGSGTADIQLSAPTAPLAWKGLYIDTESKNQPTNAKIKYTLMEQDCRTPIGGFENIDPARSPIDISSLPATTTRFCLKVSYESINQIAVTARMSYEGKEDPSISFDVVVNDIVDTATINNTATIATTTPETNYNNNSSSYQLRVPQADITLTKDVDQAVISPQDITDGKQLTYTLTLENKGPNDADGVIVTDTLPAGVTYVSAQQTSGAGNFTVTRDGQKIVLAAGSVVPVGQRATFTIVVTVDAKPMPAATTQFYNDACAAADMSDTAKDNNCDSATVTVGSFANVYLQKIAPNKANIGKEITYTVRYGNNGNMPAEKWIINDPLDKHLAFVSATQIAGDIPVACMYNAQAVTCTSQSGALLPVGATGEISIVARVAKDQALADTNTVISNKACITTATTQITVSDDCGTATTTVWPGDLAGFGGRVFLDFDKNVSYDTETDKPLADVEVVATGIDTTNYIYGPDHQHPRYVEVITALLPMLVAKGIVPAGATADAVHRSPNYVIVAPTKTSRDGTYSFSGLKPGVYYAHQSQPSPYGSTGSTGGYLGIDGGTGLPVHSPQDGRGSKQDAGVDTNLIAGIELGEGDFSQGNDFGELPGSIGSHIWSDIDNDGLREVDEAGLSGVEVTLYRDSNGDGAYTDGVDTITAITKTNENGAYMFTGLSLNNGGGSAQYIVRVTDTDKVTTGYTNTTGQARVDNNSQPATGYAVTLRRDKGADVTADFGYFRPTDVALTKEIDGNGDGVFAAQEQIRPDVAYRYRVVLDNRSLDAATDIHAEDIVPKGVAVLKATADNGTATVTNGKVMWTVSSLAPTRRATLTIEAVVANDALAAYREGLETSGVSRNTARITSLRQHDATPNNNSSHADAFMKAGLGDRVWVDYNTNGRQDNDEPGLSGVTVALRDAAGREVATTTTAAVGGKDGVYHFGDIDPGDYTVHFTVPQGYVFTTPHDGDGGADSNANQTTGATAVITITQGDNNLTVDAGVVPLLSLGDTIWDDRNGDGVQSADEAGLGGVTVMLFGDDGDGVLDITKDAQVTSIKTNTQGRYRFDELVAGNYFVVIDSADTALRGYKLSKQSSADPNDMKNRVNDGVKLGDVFTTAKPLSLQYGVQPQERGAYNDTVDFGFRKPAPAPSQPPATPPVEPARPAEPNKPQKSVDLADTGENMWLIAIASFGSIAVAIALLLLIKRRKEKNNA